jgi:hypothetical protein
MPAAGEECSDDLQFVHIVSIASHVCGNNGHSQLQSKIIATANRDHDSPIITT